MVHKYFDKKTGSGTSANEQLDKELDKPIIKKFKRRKFFARFKANIWEAINSDKYLLCAIDVFTKYTWVKPSKGKKGKTLLSGLTEIVNESNRKPNK